MKIQVFDNAETEKKVVLQVLNRTDLIECRICFQGKL